MTPEENGQWVLFQVHFLVSGVKRTAVHHFVRGLRKTKFI